jgi:serine/threonine protein kinase
VHVRTARSTGGALRFDLGAELGRGGMGRVVAAIDTALDREVAIKQAHGDGDLARFEREAKITARLEHPAIVPIHDIGRDPTGRPYYVMRRIAGEP